MARALVNAHRSRPSTRSRWIYPPMMYVDDTTIIEEVWKFETLRGGDHCLCPLNILRGGFPMLDYAVDVIANMNMFYFYHHFLILDDVAYVDKDGIPRTKTGSEVRVCEYTNTPEEFFANKNKVGWIRAIGNKAIFRVTPLSAYSGNLFYLVLEEKKLADRRKILEQVQKHIASGKVFDNYNMLFRNCEHALNVVEGRGKISKMTQFVAWNTFRACLQIVGLAFLWCIQTSGWISAIGYYSLTLAPVVLQSIACMSKTLWKLSKLSRAGILSPDTFYHLFWKELSRCLVVGGLSAFVIAIMPQLLLRRIVRSELLVGFLALVSFIFFNATFNVLAAGVTTLIVKRRRSLISKVD